MKKFLPGWEYSRQGTLWAFNLAAPARKTLSEEAVQQAVETIRNRIDQFGVSEPVIAREGENRIVVQLPGVDDPRRVKDIIKSTAFLELKLVEAGPNADRTALRQATGGQVPPDAEVVEIRQDQDPTSPKITHPEGRGRDRARHQAARPQARATSPRLVLAQGGRRLEFRVTGNIPGKQLAIVLDNRVRSAQDRRPHQTGISRAVSPQAPTIAG